MAIDLCNHHVRDVVDSLRLTKVVDSSRGIGAELKCNFCSTTPYTPRSSLPATKWSRSTAWRSEDSTFTPRFSNSGTGSMLLGIIVSQRKQEGLARRGLPRDMSIEQAQSLPVRSVCMSRTSTSAVELWPALLNEAHGAVEVAVEVRLSRPSRRLCCV